MSNDRAATQDSVQANRDVKHVHLDGDKGQAQFDHVAAEVHRAQGNGQRDWNRHIGQINQGVDLEKLGFAGAHGLKITGADVDKEGHGTIVASGNDGVRHTFNSKGEEVDKSEGAKFGKREYQFDQKGGHYSLKKGDTLDSIARDMLTKDNQDKGTDGKPNYKPTEQEVAKRVRQIAKENHMDSRHGYVGQQLDFKGEHLEGDHHEAAFEGASPDKHEPGGTMKATDQPPKSGDPSRAPDDIYHVTPPKTGQEKPGETPRAPDDIYHVTPKGEQPQVEGPAKPEQPKDHKQDEKEVEAAFDREAERVRQRHGDSWTLYSKDLKENLKGGPGISEAEIADSKRLLEAMGEYGRHKRHLFGHSDERWMSVGSINETIAKHLVAKPEQ